MLEPNDSLSSGCPVCLACWPGAQVRQLESMIRLSEALARAHLDPVVQVREREDLPLAGGGREREWLTCRSLSTWVDATC